MANNDPFSIEYLHYDGTIPLESVLRDTASVVAPILSLYPDAQRSVMFDDIHTDMGFGSYLKAVLKSETPPQSIYGEAAFRPYAKDLAAILEAKGCAIVQEGVRSFIVQKDRRNRTEHKFLFLYDDIDGDKFSCPAFVAASYLYRLGYFGSDNPVTPLYGDAPRVSMTDDILNILPRKYLQVEADARILCNLVSPAHAERIRYFFY